MARNWLRIIFWLKKTKLTLKLCWKSLKCLLRCGKFSFVIHVQEWLWCYTAGIASFGTQKLWTVARLENVDRMFLLWPAWGLCRCDQWSLFVFLQLVNINENYMSLMSDNGDIREDLRVPDNEVGKEIESKFEAGEEFMVSLVFSYNSYLSARPEAPL